MKSSSSGFWIGLPARWPQIDLLGQQTVLDPYVVGDSYSREAAAIVGRTGIARRLG
jgi:hypothetical protein